jgi:hypothetical protein
MPNTNYADTKPNNKQANTKALIHALPKSLEIQAECVTYAVKSLN